MPFYSNAEFAEKFVEEVLEQYCSDRHSQTQEQVARFLTDKYMLNLQLMILEKLHSLLDFLTV